MKKLTVFLAWQSDLPQPSTTGAIKGALNLAAVDLRQAGIVDLDIIQATSNSSGATNIPLKLAENIRVSDIIVADVTPITGLANTDDALPNANVTFELGMASVHVGWERIIMLLNKAHSAFEKMPFDFDRQRIFDYTLDEAQAKAKGGLGSLQALLKNALTAIVERDPKRPRELEGKSADEIKRVRDLENLRWVMRHISTNAIDRHIAEMPKLLNYESVMICENLKDVCRRTDFHLYDQELYDGVVSLKESLSHSLAYMEKYDELPGRGDRQVFRHSAMGSADGSDGTALKDTRQALRELNACQTKLVAIIRDRYLEVDIDDTNRHFEKGYKEWKASLEDED